MGYLDNSTIVVDAVLTKEGRQRLAQGNSLNISFFSLSDSGVDYRLWNPDHPSGSAFYGEAIENLPSLEAIPRAEFYMRNKLITLSQDVTGLPYWDLNDTATIQLVNGVDNIGTNASPGEANYNGIDVQFTFNQATITSAFLIVHNGAAIPDLSLVGQHSSGQYSNTVVETEDIDGTSYQALVNTESSNPKYFQILEIENNIVGLNFKRGTNTSADSMCTIIDPNSGIFATFNLQVRPL